MTDYSDISWEDTKDPAALNTNPEVYKQYSRDFVRTPFQWDTQRWSGFTEGNSTWLPVNPNYRALNLKSQQEGDKSHWKLYQQLVRLRRREFVEEVCFLLSFFWQLLLLLLLFC